MFYYTASKQVQAEYGQQQNHWHRTQPPRGGAPGNRQARDGRDQRGDQPDAHIKERCAAARRTSLHRSGGRDTRRHPPHHQ